MILTHIVGTRPNFVKLAPLIRELRKDHINHIIHTGQHYHDALSESFFRELEIPEPDVNLGVGSHPIATQVGRSIERIGEVLGEPDMVIVYGDTASTLAGALAARLNDLPVAHVEAGVRSYNRSMPEEIDRTVVDHISDLLFCPNPNAVNILRGEGVTDGVYCTGDVNVDAANLVIGKTCRSDLMELFGITPKKYLLLTIHRPVNANSTESLKTILSSVNDFGMPVIFPVHPRTRKNLPLDYEGKYNNISFIPPAGFIDTIHLVKNAYKVVTDSGGLVKEAYILNTPCITIREETEWPETRKLGWNILVHVERQSILDALYAKCPTQKPKHNPFPEGACRNIVKIIRGWGQR